jgi:hypothetical protein
MGPEEVEHLMDKRAMGADSNLPPGLYMSYKVTALKKRKQWEPPVIDYTYAKGLDDIDALRQIRSILTAMSDFVTADQYRRACGLIRRLRNSDFLSLYVREAAKQASDYMDDFEALGYIEKGEWKSILPQNAAYLKLSMWKEFGEGFIATTWLVGNRIKNDKFSVDLPPHVIVTRDGTLMSKRHYYKTYKYAALGLTRAELTELNLHKQCMLAMASMSDMSPDSVADALEPEKQTRWLTAVLE